MSNSFLEYTNIHLSPSGLRRGQQSTMAYFAKDKDLWLDAYGVYLPQSHRRWFLRFLFFFVKFSLLSGLEVERQNVT